MFAYKRRRKDLWYNPESEQKYGLSRFKIELYFECPQCFYLDCRLGVGRPFGPPFTLNNAVDALLKKEFDVHRERGTWHPVLKAHDIRVKPFKHKDIENWREQDYGKGGIRFDIPDTNLTAYGAVDDVWENAEGELIIADYKATAKENNDDVSLNADWQISYKRQAEMYQWLFRQNGFKVNKTAYFYYVNGQLSEDKFGDQLKFAIKVIPYEGDDSWILPKIKEIYEVLKSKDIPPSGEHCEYCAYRNFQDDALGRDAFVPGEGGPLLDTIELD